MKTLKLICAILFTTILLSGCILENKEAIFTINSEPITQAQYDKEYKASTNTEQYNALAPEIKNDPDSYINLIVKFKVLNEIIGTTLLEQEISKKNITVSEEEVDDEIVAITDQFGSKEKFMEILKQNNRTLSEFKKEVLYELKLRKLINTLSLVNVTDKEIEKFYKENIKEFQYPDQVRASHILIMADRAAIADSIKTMNKDLTNEQIEERVKEELGKKLAKTQEILTELKKDPTKFAQIAKEYSEDTLSAKNGGDLGFFTYEQMVEPFSKAAFAQKVNVIGEIIQTSYGYHIIMVTDRKSAGVEPLSAVKEQLSQFIKKQKEFQVLVDLIESLKNKAQIVYIDEAYNLNAIQQKIEQIKKENPALNVQPQSAKE